MSSQPKFVDLEQAAQFLTNLATGYRTNEVAVVRNPSYVHPAFDLYLLAPRRKTVREQVIGIVKDMDGTTTTTEPLCIHSLEYMVRRITGRMKKSDWVGLDATRDYPHIIGNSTTKHVEYLISQYEPWINPDAFKRAYLSSVIWTLSVGQDEGRKREVRNNLNALGLGKLAKEERFNRLINQDTFDEAQTSEAVEYFIQNYGAALHVEEFTDRVRAAIDIYYTRYHEILAAIDRGQGEYLSKELLADPKKRLVEPMPGVGMFLALIKGWLGEDLELFFEEMSEYLISHPKTEYKTDQLAAYRTRLAPLGKFFQEHPARVAVVTSSIEYEANIVLTEVFSVIRKQILNWPISEQKKAELLSRFQNPRSLYDGFVTASDSSEIRLKPHRDLYSIALHQLGITPAQFENVIGFEDSESGTIAIRAAGIGLCVAVPFADTQGHDLTAATHILQGGLPEAVLVHACFLPEERLQKN